MELKHPESFFKVVKRIVYPQKLTQTQVNGINALVSNWKGTDPRFLAYILATAKRECRFNLSIKETGRGATKAYGKPDKRTGQVYYGRGPVQLTWYDNYKKMGDLLGIDLIHNPDKVLDPSVGVRVMYFGMEKGSFTGKKLSDYFNDHEEDPYNARRIVNGLDAAREIEVDYWLFKLALLEGML
jgi:putative chitinase